MLRYMLLAGAAALALPGASLAQVQWSEPLPGENNASSAMDNPGVLDSPTDYDIPFNQAPTGFNADSYATAQQDRTRTPVGDAYVPDESDDTATAQSPQAGNGVYGSQPSGGYYFGSQGDQPLLSPVAEQGSYGGPPQGGYSGGPPQGAYSSPSYQGYTGGGYDASQQGPATNYSGGPPEGGVYGAPPVGQGAYSNPPPSRGYGGGYYTGDQGAYGGQGGYDNSQANAGEVQGQNTQDLTANTGQPLVIVPASGLSSRKYVRETTAANLYQIRAARIALRRSRSPQVRDYASQMIQQHRQGLALIIQASFQAGVPQLPRMDQAHRLMLARLRRVSAGNFDAVYMNQQVVTHMNQAAVQSGYALNGDNSVLQQVASQSNPAVQQHLGYAWNMTGQPERLAARRDSELALLDQNAGRGQTYRGYTVIGPTSTAELASRRRSTYRGYAYRGYTSGGAGYAGRRIHRRGYYDQFNYNLKGSSPTGVSYRQGGATGGGYQGYTSGAGAQQPGSAGTTGVPGSPGYGTTTPGTSPGTPGYGGPQYQGYSNPNQGQNQGQNQGMGQGPGQGPGTTGAPPATGSPSYQGYTAPGSPGYTSPGGQGPMGAPPYQGSPGSPGYSPGPGYQGSVTPPNSPNPNSPNPNGV